MKKGIIVIDPTRCTACKTCELECAIAHSDSKVASLAINEEPRSLPRIRVKLVDGFNVPLQCRHCDHALCMEACPKDAITRPDKDGPVLIDPELCIGCTKCVYACPFGAIKMRKEGKGKKAIKCNLCIERLKKDEIPACVSSCPTGVFEFKPIKEKKDKKFLVIFSKKEQEKLAKNRKISPPKPKKKG